MKRCITIFLFLLAVAGLRAQTPDISNCRMMKAEATLTQVNGKTIDADPSVKICITLCYGAKSSGYVSDDYIYLLGDDSDVWNRYGCMSFMDMPASTEKNIDGDTYQSVYNFFYGDKLMLCTNVTEIDNILVKSVNNIVISPLSNPGNICNYNITSCDFYDISTGQERLVLKGHIPSLYEINTSDNLFRVFMDRMYEYYNSN